MSDNSPVVLFFASLWSALLLIVGLIMGWRMRGGYFPVPSVSNPFRRPVEEDEEKPQEKPKNHVRV